MSKFGTTPLDAVEIDCITRNNLVLRFNYDVSPGAARIITSVEQFNEIEQNAVWVGYDTPFLAAGLHQTEEYYFDGFKWGDDEPQAPEFQPCFLGVHPPELIPYVMAVLMNGEDPARPIRFTVAQIPDDHFQFVRKLTNGQYRQILSLLADMSYEEIMVRLTDD